jgi:hypothetical protein
VIEPPPFATIDTVALDDKRRVIIEYGIAWCMVRL